MSKLLSATTRDLAGRTTTVVEGDSTHQMRWDVRGNLTSRARDGQAVWWDYDANSRRTKMVRPNGVATRYEYDSNSQIGAFTHEGLGRAIIDRDPLGRIVSVHADGLYASWEYSDGAITAQRVERDGFISDTRISRDADGRVISERTDGITTTYSYDASGQLIQATTSEGLETRWTYDANGRMTAEDAAGKTTRHRYDRASQLVAMAGPDGDTQFSYDGAGRRVAEDGPDGSVASAGTRVGSWRRLPPSVT